MKQSRLMSLVESVTNVIIGYGVAVVTQILIFPIFGLHTTLEQNLQMGAVFTVVSIARSFALRRLFEAVRIASNQSRFGLARLLWRAFSSLRGPFARRRWGSG
ncbi:DUF7220 family protein, partial [Paracoccus marinus]|uniref:DUF7220 family protein n=1 Tax=Paracoccus marinus TaxID=288426 RepID=UPI003CCC558F